MLKMDARSGEEAQLPAVMSSTAFVPTETLSTRECALALPDISVPLLLLSLMTKIHLAENADLAYRSILVKTVLTVVAR